MFLSSKKDNKPTILSPINTVNSINRIQKKKLDFTSLAFENKEKPINYIDFDNSSKEDDIWKKIIAVIIVALKKKIKKS